MYNARIKQYVQWTWQMCTILIWDHWIGKAPKTCNRKDDGMSLLCENRWDEYRYGAHAQGFDLDFLTLWQKSALLHTDEQHDRLVTDNTCKVKTV